MQRIWAWTQCIAIDASVAGTIIRTFRYSAEGEKVKILIEEWKHSMYGNVDWLWKESWTYKYGKYHQQSYQYANTYENHAKSGNGDT